MGFASANSSEDWRCRDVLRIAIAIVLLTAAVLKADRLMREPALQTNLVESRWFLIGVVECELLLALWLLSRLFPCPLVAEEAMTVSHPRRAKMK
jgi:hypothetical protein